jgi:PE-PPE domain
LSHGRIRRVTVGGLSALTVGSILGLAPTPPQSVGTVDLTALIAVGSSTNPSGGGVQDFYGGTYIPPDHHVVVVNFFTGPAGIEQALQGSSGQSNVVLASGWGASNANQVLVHDAGDPNVTGALWVLDNNLNNPNGGFGTRYPLFSRLVGIDPTPSPTDTATVVDVKYEYDINSDAPAYPLNVVAMANSLVAYLYGHLNQQNLQLPVNADGSPVCAAPCTVTTADGNVVHLEKIGSVTYVTYETKGLPLVRPLRDFGGPSGNEVANLIEAPLTAVVDWGYPNNDPLGSADTLRPARLVPTPQETATFVGDLTNGVTHAATNGVTHGATSGVTPGGTTGLTQPAPTVAAPSTTAPPRTVSLTLAPVTAVPTRFSNVVKTSPGNSGSGAARNGQPGAAATSASSRSAN